MIIKLKKQAEKYLAKCDKSSFDKISDALESLAELNWDIIKLKGRKNEYRLKIPPYRVIFEYIAGNDYIMVIKISPRGDAYK